MGLCGSKGALSPADQKALKEAKKRSKELDKQQMEDHHKDSLVNKLLLLGAGESGKSTLFKQMITIWGTGFSEAERKNYIRVIHNNILSSMKTLITQSQRLAEEGDSSAAIDESLHPVSEAVLDLSQSDPIDEKIADNLKQLWADPGIKHTYDLRATFQLTDSAAYFFDRLDVINDATYIPTEQDVLRSRVRTTGIVENEFEIDGNKFQMFDVGGQRNERKKWIHCFSDVTAVIFVAALSAYDQVLFEDESTNRMVEALNLFEEICNSRWFRKTSIILMLNKRDLFDLKVTFHQDDPEYQPVPLTVCPAFSDYDGGQTYDEATEYIHEKFKERFAKRASDSNQGLYVHFTCATDTTNVRIVFNAVKDIIIRKSLQEGGLLA